MMSGGLEGKVALVTGGASGMGAASALALAEAGADVIVTDLRPTELAEMATAIEGLGRKAMTVLCDVSDEAAMASLFADIAQKFGRLDIVLANAGINGTWTPIDEMTPAEWDLTIRVNLRGTYLTVHHAVPLMKANGGSIVIVSSINGTRTFTTAGATAYSAAKAGQFAIGQQLALELARYRIRVNVICPGSVATRIGENTWKRNTEAAQVSGAVREVTVPLTGNKLAAVTDIAKLVVFLSSDAASHITGTPVYIDGAQSLLT